MALIPSQKYRLKWPLTPNQLINIDEMFLDIFEFLKKLYGLITDLTATVTALTSTVSTLSAASSQQSIITESEEASPWYLGASPIDTTSAAYMTAAKVATRIAMRI
jgi:hypothetical protein